jgi:hypothetical protein
MSKELRESKVAWKKLRKFMVAAALVAAGASGAYVVSTGAVFFGGDGIVTRQRTAVAAPWPDARIRESGPATASRPARRSQSSSRRRFFARLRILRRIGRESAAGSLS